MHLMLISVPRTRGSFSTFCYPQFFFSRIYEKNEYGLLVASVEFFGLILFLTVGSCFFRCRDCGKQVYLGEYMIYNQICIEFDFFPVTLHC